MSSLNACGECKRVPVHRQHDFLAKDWLIRGRTDLLLNIPVAWCDCGPAPTIHGMGPLLDLLKSTERNVAVRNMSMGPPDKPLWRVEYTL